MEESLTRLGEALKWFMATMTEKLSELSEQISQASGDGGGFRSQEPPEGEVAVAQVAIEPAGKAREPDAEAPEQDVETAEQAGVVEEAGAYAATTQERNSADIHGQGGMACMSAPALRSDLKRAGTISGRAKDRNSSFVEAQFLEVNAGVPFVSGRHVLPEIEVFTSSDDFHHIHKPSDPVFLMIWRACAFKFHAMEQAKKLGINSRPPPEPPPIALVRYLVLLTLAETQIAKDVSNAFWQMSCGFKLSRCPGGSHGFDVDEGSFIKYSYKFDDDVACYYHILTATIKESDERCQGFCRAGKYRENVDNMIKSSKFLPVETVDENVAIYLFRGVDRSRNKALSLDHLVNVNIALTIGIKARGILINSNIDECLNDSKSVADEQQMGRATGSNTGDGLAVVILAGGKRMRLGSSDPKGYFRIRPLSGKSLFQIQIEQILSVQKLVAQYTDSPGTLPCIFGESRFIMGTPCKVTKVPDCNGGVCAAEDMAARVVKYIDCSGIDKLEDVDTLFRRCDHTYGRLQMENTDEYDRLNDISLSEYNCPENKMLHTTEPSAVVCDKQFNEDYSLGVDLVNAGKDESDMHIRSEWAYQRNAVEVFPNDQACNGPDKDGYMNREMIGSEIPSGNMGEQLTNQKFSLASESERGPAENEGEQKHSLVFTSSSYAGSKSYPDNSCYYSPAEALNERGYKIYGQLGYGEDNSLFPCLLERFQEWGSPVTFGNEAHRSSNSQTPLRLSSVNAGKMLAFAIDSLGSLWTWGNCLQQTDTEEFCIASSSVSLPMWNLHGHTVVKVACGNEHVVAAVSAGETYMGGDLVC